MPPTLLIGIRKKRQLTTSIAALTFIRGVTCPYCSSIFNALVLGKVVEKLDKRPMKRSKSLMVWYNKKFAESHLSNPLVCPSCGREFVLFLGIELDLRFKRIKDIDIVITKKDDNKYSNLINWPHVGLVMKEIIEYYPHEAVVYEDLKQFIEKNGDLDEIVGASSVDSFEENAQNGGAAPEGSDGSAGFPRRFSLAGGEAGDR